MIGGLVVPVYVYKNCWAWPRKLGGGRLGLRISTAANWRIDEWFVVLLRLQGWAGGMGWNLGYRIVEWLLDCFSYVYKFEPDEC